MSTRAQGRCAASTFARLAHNRIVIKRRQVSRSTLGRCRTETGVYMAQGVASAPALQQGFREQSGPSDQGSPPRRSRIAIPMERSTSARTIAGF